jgi:predicted metalloprotease
MGGGGGMAIGGGLGTIVLVLVALFFGVDPRALLEQAPQTTPQTAPSQPGARPSDEGGQFVSAVLGSTEDVWRQVFPQQAGRPYREPTLVLFENRVQSACGGASAAVGPFYCPADQKVYLDLSFFRELSARFGAPGDFAAAYVVAHEVGHHIQNQLGLTRRVDAARGRVSEREYNDLSVRLELQADFLAGVWAHHAQRSDLLDPGDIEEAMRAAEAIGDDKLQQQGQGYVVPDSFTHGSSAQRARWFRRGYETGDIRQGDTFSAPSL